MNVLIHRGKFARLAAALVAGAISVSFVTGCGSTPSTNSVDMGGEAGAVKNTPGLPAPEPGKTQTIQEGNKKVPVRSIKERPGG